MLRLVGERPGVTVAELAAELKAEAKQRWGKLGYGVAALGLLRRARPFTATLIHDGRTERVRTIQVSVGNGKHYGGGMTVAEDDRPDDAATALQQHVSRLRRALAPHDVVLTRAPGYLVEREAGDLDVDRFERLCESGRQRLATGDAAGAAETLRQALALWRGRPLGDLELEPFAAEAVARQLGVGKESVRRWVVQAEVDGGGRPGTTSEESAEIKKLKAENRRLREDNEILKAATTFFVGELDPRNR